MHKLLLLLLAALPCLAPAQTRRALFSKSAMGEIRLKLPTNWNNALDSMRLYGNGMLSGNANIDGASYANVGVRFRGDKSYQLGLKRNPLLIQIDHSAPGQNHEGYTAVKLSSALRDPSLVREVLFAEIAGKYMPAPQACYTKLFVNDEYIGIFVNVENVEDAPFRERYFGTKEGSLFKAGVDHPADAPATCRQNIFGSLEYEEDMNCYKGNFEMGGKKGWSDLQELARILNSDPKNVGKVLDIDRTLWMLALNNAVVNLSSYSGAQSTNYYLIQDKNGRFSPVHWDLNLSFGSFKNTGTGSDLELRDLQELSPLLHADNPYKPLINQLLKDPFYKKIYIAHLKQIIDENFRNGSYERRAQELQGQIVVAFSEDRYKFYSLEEFQSSLKTTIGKRSRIPGLTELMGRRAAFLREHAELTVLPPAITDVTVLSRGKYESKLVNAFRVTARADRFPRRLQLYYRFSDGAPYTAIQMGDDAAGSLPSGVKAYLANIEAPGPDAVLDYYLIAETAGSVAFAPLNYTVKPYKVKLSDLNK